MSPSLLSDDKQLDSLHLAGLNDLDVGPMPEAPKSSRKISKLFTGAEPAPAARFVDVVPNFQMFPQFHVLRLNSRYYM
jgi:hypothetical protein